MIALIVSLLLDLGHCARWQATPRGPACADVRLDAPGWHEFGRQRINVCSRDCGAEGPVS